MKWTDISTTQSGYRGELEVLEGQTPHERLGISTTATLSEAKKAY